MLYHWFPHLTNLKNFSELCEAMPTFNKKNIHFPEYSLPLLRVFPSLANIYKQNSWAPKEAFTLW